MCSLAMNHTPSDCNIPIYGSHTPPDIDRPEHVTDRDIIDVCGGDTKLQHTSNQQANTSQNMETADKLLALAQQLMVMRQTILHSSNSTTSPPATTGSQYVPFSAFTPETTNALHPTCDAVTLHKPSVFSVSSAWIPYSKIKRELPPEEAGSHNSSATTTISNPQHSAKFVLLEDMSYQCNACTYKAKQHNQILRHWKIHSGERPYQCTQCDYSAALKHNLVQHMWSRHSRIKKYKCNECDYSATRKDYLASHKTQHTGKKPFKCHLCNWTTGLRSNMTQHMKRKH